MEGGEGLLAIDRVLVLESKGPEINTNLTHKLSFIEATKERNLLVIWDGWVGVFHNRKRGAQRCWERGHTRSSTTTTRIVVQDIRRGAHIPARGRISRAPRAAEGRGCGLGGSE
jgi:hypothetical protein